MHRFFVPPEWIQDTEARLEGAQARQVSRVLRARRGDRLVLMDGKGMECHAEVRAILDGAVKLRVIERRPAPPEPRLSITLYQGLLKGKKQDWVFQKGTEIGVSAFVPLLCDRCVTIPSEERGDGRWAPVIKEAAEQCGRGQLPRLLPPAAFSQACREAARPAFLLWESPDAPSFKDALRRAPQSQPDQASIFVGPEGGFAPHEYSFGTECGLVPVSLGKRILRAETAGLVAAAMLLYEYGDLG